MQLCELQGQHLHHTLENLSETGSSTINRINLVSADNEV
jgi:hypothetical protein